MGSYVKTLVQATVPKKNKANISSIEDLDMKLERSRAVSCRCRRMAIKLTTSVHLPFILTIITFTLNLLVKCYWGWDICCENRGTNRVSFRTNADSNAWANDDWITCDLRHFTSSSVISGRRMGWKNGIQPDSNNKPPVLPGLLGQAAVSTGRVRSGPLNFFT